jgi:hypothetical protein
MLKTQISVVRFGAKETPVCLPLSFFGQPIAGAVAAKAALFIRLSATTIKQYPWQTRELL